MGPRLRAARAARGRGETRNVFGVGRFTKLAYLILNHRGFASFRRLRELVLISVLAAFCGGLARILRNAAVGRRLILIASPTCNCRWNKIAFAAGLRAQFADAARAPLPEYLAALMRELEDRPDAASVYFLRRLTPPWKFEIRSESSRLHASVIQR
jgi:hypothetical protein